MPAFSHNMTDLEGLLEQNDFLLVANLTANSTSDEMYSIRNIGIGVIGVALNLTALILILLSAIAKTPIKVFIVALIISDLIFTVALVFHDLLQVVLSTKGRSQGCWAFIFMALLSTTISQEMTAVLSTFNFLALYHPLVFRDLGVKLPLFVCLLLWVMSAAVTYPSVNWAVTSGPRCIPSTSLGGYRSVGILVLWGISISIVLFLNGSIIWKLKTYFSSAQVLKKGRSNNRSNGEDDIANDEPSRNTLCFNYNLELADKRDKGQIVKSNHIMMGSYRTHLPTKNGRRFTSPDITSVTDDNWVFRFRLQRCYKQDGTINHDMESNCESNQCIPRYIQHASTKPVLSVSSNSVATRIPDESMKSDCNTITRKSTSKLPKNRGSTTVDERYPTLSSYGDQRCALSHITVVSNVNSSVTSRQNSSESIDKLHGRQRFSSQDCKGVSKTNSLQHVDTSWLDVNTFRTVDEGNNMLKCKSPQQVNLNAFECNSRQQLTSPDTPIRNSFQQVNADSSSKGKSLRQIFRDTSRRHSLQQSSVSSKKGIELCPSSGYQEIPPIITVAANVTSVNNSHQSTAYVRGSKLRHTADTLIMLSLWCCLLNMPFFLYAIWLSGHDTQEIETLSLRPIGIVSSTLIGVNSLGNPFLYAWRFINWTRIRQRIRDKFRNLRL